MWSVQTLITAGWYRQLAVQLTDPRYTKREAPKLDLLEMMNRALISMRTKEWSK